MNFRFPYRRGPLEEIEVAPAIGLADVLRIQPAESARILCFTRFPCRTPAPELVVAHAQRQPPPRHIELDDVAVLDERERTADEGLGGDVQNARAVARAAHPRVRYPHHVAHPLREQ